MKTTKKKSKNKTKQATKKNKKATKKQATTTATKKKKKNTAKSKAPTPAGSSTSIEEHLRRADAALGRVIDRVGAYRPPLDETSSLYEALCRSIVYQQIHGKAAAAIFERVRALGDGGAFPTPARLLSLPEASLRGAGLSSAKMNALLDLARHTESGVVPTMAQARTLDDDELKRRLTTVRGIGPWTVEMLLIFRLGRPDVMPATDYGVRQGFQRAFRHKELPAPSAVLARAERWRPFRSAAAWYLWRVLDNPAGRA